MTSPNSGSIRILVADDHALFRNGVAALLQQQQHMLLVAEASDGQMAVDHYKRHCPDITLMDLQMPGMGGLEAIAAIRRHDSLAKIIALTTYRSDVLVTRALQAGASSYLLKSTLVEEMFATIERVHNGARYIPADVAQILSAEIPAGRLTRREIDVLALAAEGNSNKGIARKLGIGEETVKGYMSALFQKLGASDRTHAVALALKQGIIDYT